MPNQEEESVQVCVWMKNEDVNGIMCKTFQELLIEGSQALSIIQKV